ncbi:MAG: OB-fold nucleic acid binding domain-containing protein, partial [Nitrospiria bacterium]
MEKDNSQVGQRKKKLTALREAGQTPYGTRFEGKKPVYKLIEKYEEATKETLAEETVSCKVAGRIVSLRRFGKAAFAHIQDVTGKIQIYFKKDILGPEGTEIFGKVDLGDSLGIEGVLFRTKTDELTVEARQLTFLSKSLNPLPEKWHGLC